MSNSFKMTYNVDMVFCIDATGSMGNVINMVKENAVNFYNDVTSNMMEKNKVINQIRIRIVTFRDYIADGNEAMLVTDFFNLPKDTLIFRDCVNSIVAKGGGDEPEDGLEALGYAIRSPWYNDGIKRRQVIVVWTDASTHKLGHGVSNPIYPKMMAKTFDELTSWWGDSQQPGFIDQQAKRLLLFTPDSEYWTTISSNWDNVLHFQSIAGQGLREYDYSQIINSITNTI